MSDGSHWRERRPVAVIVVSSLPNARSRRDLRGRPRLRVPSGATHDARHRLFGSSIDREVSGERVGGSMKGAGGVASMRYDAFAQRRRAVRPPSAFDRWAQARPTCPVRRS